MSIKINLLENEPNRNIFTPSVLTPSKSRDLVIQNISIFTSQRADNYEFTNFLNKNNKEQCLIILADLLCDLKENKFKNIDISVDECDLSNLDLEKKLRICNILNLYDKSITPSNLSSVNKAKVKNRASGTTNTSFRIYLSISPDCYKLILLDPLHYVIPSSKQYEKGNTFKENKGNSLCMKQHLIYKDSNLKKLFEDLEESIKPTQTGATSM